MDNYRAITRTEKIVGRKKQLDRVEEILKQRDVSYAFYLFGGPGLGKTRLLEEIGALTNTLEPAKFSFAWSGLVDLYHSQTQNNLGLEWIILQGLDPEKEFFADYRQLRQKFESDLAQGLTGASLEADRKKLSAQFREDYRRLAKARRIVLTFDTVELIQHERDQAQDVCQIDGMGTSVKQWLIKQASKLPNTVIIFAGRPDNKLKAELKTTFENFEELEVKPFSFSETEFYLELLTDRYPERLTTILDNLSLRQQIHERTGGRPIYIGLAVDMLLDTKL